MKMGFLSSFVALSHLVLSICTFHDPVYSHFIYVSLRIKNQKGNILSALTLKEYASQIILSSMDSVDGWGMEGKQQLA